MPTPLPSPSAICTVNGNVISDVNTSGINVPSGSTITVALANIAGVNSWSISCTQADDITHINGNFTAVNNSKVQSAFSATFVVPPLIVQRGAGLQFTSIVNEGEHNEHRFTFGVWVLNLNGERLFFGSESFESNATVGNAAELNDLLTNLGIFTAGGDLAGTFFSQTVIGLQNRPLLSTAPTTGQFLEWNGTAWGPANLSAALTFAGDLSGSLTTQTVTGLQNHPVNGTAPTNGQVLVWDNADGYWKPTTGSTPGGPAGGDLEGTYPNPTIQSITPVGGTLFIDALISGQGEPVAFIRRVIAMNDANYTLTLTDLEAYFIVVQGGTALTADRFFIITTGLGSYPAGSVMEIHNNKTANFNIVATDNIGNPGVTIPFGHKIKIVWDGSHWQPWGFIAGNASASITSDLSGTNQSQQVVAITGASGAVNIASTGNILTWNTATTAPGLKQADKTTNSGTGAAMTIQSQNETGTTSTGGDLILTSGTGTSADGYVYLETGGHVRFTAKPTGVITIANLGAGVVHADASGNLTSSAVNLAGGASEVTGVLPAGNQASQAMGGDVTGTTAASTVVKIQGNTFTAGSPTKGQFVVATTTSNYGPVTLSKDISESATTPGQLTVIGIQGNAVQSASYGAAQDGYVLTWVNGSSQVQMIPTVVSGAAGGDLSGTYPNPTVAKIDGTTIGTAGGALTTGKVLRVTGAATADWGAVDLANASAVTGTLPVGNLPSLVGDVSGTLSTTKVDKISGGSGTVIVSSVIGGDTSNPIRWKRGLIAMGNSDYTLSGSDQSCYRLVFQGGTTLTADRNIICPGINGSYFEVFNGQTAGFNLIFKASSGTGVTVPYNSRATIEYDGTNYVPYSAVFGNASASITSDVNGTNQSQTVVGIQGNTFTSGSPTKGQFVMATSTSNYGPVTLTGDLSESSSTAGLITVISINSATVPAAGSLTTGNVLQVSGASTLTYAALNVGGGAGYVTGQLPVTNVANGTAGQILVTNSGATAPAWVSMSGDSTITAAGVVTNVGIQTKTLDSSLASIGAAQDGYALVWVNGSSAWKAQPQSGGGGGSVTWTLDLSGSNNTQQWVTGISGSGGTGGTVTMGDSSHNLLMQQVNSGANTTPTLTIQGALAANAPASSTDGYAASAFTLKSGTGGDAAGPGGHNGGNGGDLVFVSGAGGAKVGGGTVGSSGNISLQLGATEIINISGGTVGNVTFTNTAAVPNITQTALGSTSGGSGSAGQNFSITAQAGQAATGAAHNGGNGGNVVITAGAGGTSGSATAGKAGYINLASGQVRPTATKTSAYTLTYADHHIFANPSGAFNLTLPVPVNGLTYHIWDISGTANTNNVSLVRNGSEKIAGIAATYALQANWGHWTITSNGTDWFIG